MNSSGLIDPADGCRRLLRNVSTCLPIYTASYGSAILAVSPKGCRWLYSCRRCRRLQGAAVQRYDVTVLCLQKSSNRRTQWHGCSLRRLMCTVHTPVGNWKLSGFCYVHNFHSVLYDSGTVASQLEWYRQTDRHTKQGDPLSLLFKRVHISAERVESIHTCISFRLSVGLSLCVFLYVSMYLFMCVHC
jgi:hypothetical protein